MYLRVCAFCFLLYLCLIRLCVSVCPSVCYFSGNTHMYVHATHYTGSCTRNTYIKNKRYSHIGLQYCWYVYLNTNLRTDIQPRTQIVPLQFICTHTIRAHTFRPIHSCIHKSIQKHYIHTNMTYIQT